MLGFVRGYAAVYSDATHGLAYAGVCLDLVMAAMVANCFLSHWLQHGSSLQVQSTQSSSQYCVMLCSRQQCGSAWRSDNGTITQVTDEEPVSEHDKEERAPMRPCAVQIMEAMSAVHPSLSFEEGKDDALCHALGKTVMTSLSQKKARSDQKLFLLINIELQVFSISLISILVVFQWRPLVDH